MSIEEVRWTTLFDGDDAWGFGEFDPAPLSKDGGDWFATHQDHTASIPTDSNLPTEPPPVRIPNSGSLDDLPTSVAEPPTGSSDDVVAPPVPEALQDHFTAWSAYRRSAGPTDRPTAENAIRALYKERGEEAPMILWVRSPQAGIATYHLARQGYEPLTNPHARGDIGSGENREFNALADPFALTPSLTGRMWTHLSKLLSLPADGWPRRTVQDRLSDTAGLGQDRQSLVDLVRIALEAPTDLAGARPMTNPAVTNEVIAFGRQVIGPLWDEITSVVGTDLTTRLVMRSITRAFRKLTDPSGSVREARQAMHGGVWDQALPLIAAFDEPLSLPARGAAASEARRRQIRNRVELARAAGHYWALRGLAILCERPTTVLVDDQGRLHSDSGPAMRYPDGWSLWAWHGLRVPEWVISDPARIDLETILDESNAEMRRVLIERADYAQLVASPGAEKVHEDHTGILWSFELVRASDRWRWAPPSRPTVFQVVEVLNATPEADGSRHRYFLHVPPTITTAHGGVAWTFGLPAKEYHPQIET